MNTELTNTDVKSVAEVQQNVNVIKQVLDSVMIDKVHYDIIPGCGNKKVLLKPGAEKILTTFNLAPEIIVEDLSTENNKFYRVKVRIIHQPTGKFLGEGIGECSSLETKYAWRSALCDEEYDDTPETQRRINYSKNWNTKGVDKIKQVRQCMHTIGNTILKMAKKRALVDACMNVTACSDIFEQDLDENHIREAVNNDPVQPTYSTPEQETPVNGPQYQTISEKQAKLFWAKLNQFGLPATYANEVCKANNIDKIDQLPAQFFNEVLKDMESRKQG